MKSLISNAIFEVDQDYAMRISRVLVMQTLEGRDIIQRFNGYKNDEACSSISSHKPAWQSELT